RHIRVGAGIEGVEEAGDQGLLDLRAAEASRGLCHGVQVERGGVPLALAEVDLEDLPALFLGGQIDEEDLIEASLPQQLRRELLDVIARPDDEDGLALLLQPGNEGGKNARGGAAVAEARRLRPC